MQEKLAARKPHRARIRSRSPFAGKLICGDCGMYYGHKVWHNHANTERYDVWYCGHKYDGNDICRTPVLRENEIKAAFETMQRKRGVDKPTYGERRWREQVERVTVYHDRSMIFALTDGTEVKIAP